MKILRSRVSTCAAPDHAWQSRDGMSYTSRAESYRDVRYSRCPRRATPLSFRATHSNLRTSPTQNSEESAFRFPRKHRQKQIPRAQTALGMTCWFGWFGCFGWFGYFGWFGCFGHSPARTLRALWNLPFASLRANRVRDGRSSGRIMLLSVRFLALSLRVPRSVAPSATGRWFNLHGAPDVNSHQRDGTG
jgi:hypothetical protein